MTQIVNEQLSNNALPKATNRDWIGLAVLSLPCMLYAMDLTVLNMATPSISKALQPSAAQLLWIMDIYGFLIAGLLITMGALGDRIGRRKLLMIGAASFGAASIVAAYAPTAEWLIAARALLGIAGATLAPSTLSLIRNMFLNDNERSFAIGIWVASFSAGGVLGPLIGGVMLEFFHWGSVFLLNPPVMILLLILGPIILPEFRDPNAGKPDLISTFLAIAAVLAMIYGIKQMAEEGLTLLPTGIFVLGVVITLLFIQRQTQLADPLIDIRLFKNPIFTTALIINMLALFAVFGYFLFIAQYMQLVLNMTPLEAGLWSAPSGLMFVVGSMVGPKLAQYFSVAKILAWGFFISAIGFLILTQIPSNNESDYGVALFIVGYLLFCMGISPIGSLTTDIVISSAPPEKAGAASAISETSFEFGGAIGIGVLGSVLTATYRSVMENRVSKNDETGIIREAMAAAENTLSGALSAAEKIPAEYANIFMTIAREAFTYSMHMTSVLCAIVMAITAVVTFKYLNYQTDK